jgi:glycosyltransferase involved in cell wall biosynthesis
VLRSSTGGGLEEIMNKDLTPQISIIIPTRNRSGKLLMALNSLSNMHIPELISLEIVIIDNNSEDNTKYVIEAFIEKTDLNVRYVFENMKGLSYARNNGIKIANGEFIVFIDDDVIVHKNYIAELFKLVNKGKKFGMIFGQARIYSLNLHRLSIKDVGYEEIYKYPCIPWIIGNGNNMVISKTTINEIGYFDIRLGAGTKIGSAEDTDYVYRVLRSGMEIIYSPNLLIHHNHDRILPDQINRVKYNYAKGRGAFYCKYILKKDIWALKYFKDEIMLSIKNLKNTRNHKEFIWNIKGLTIGIIYQIQSFLASRG